MTKPKFRSLFSFTKQDVDSAFKYTKKIAQMPGLTLLGLKISEKAHEQGLTVYGKLLIIIPKKVGKAHERNKLRRRIREIFYKNALYAKPITSILLVYEPAKQLTFSAITDFLKKAFV